ncbi:Clp protease N-terminal domain-containing protein [Kitasatospora sp. NPDC059571]|uniref:Clp protease N-terminal domain-containing protein n=1 Tax=Kitasatospora sp. NPDC059571 TaxID=3346871 RepID=UPI00367D0CFB
MFERFTGPARQAVTRAQGEARALGSDRIGAEHLLLAILSDPGDPVAVLLARSGVDHAAARADVGRRAAGTVDGPALAAIGVDLAAVREAVESAFGEGALERRPPAERAPRRRPAFSPGARKVLELALREAIRLHQKEIATGHLLLGVLRAGEGPALDVLAAHGVDPAALRRDVEAGLGSSGGRAA